MHAFIFANLFFCPLDQIRLFRVQLTTRDNLWAVGRFQIIVVWWHRMTSWNFVNIGSVNRLSLVQWHAINWTNVEFLENREHISVRLNIIYIKEKHLKMPNSCNNDLSLGKTSGWGLGAFLRWWPPSAMWVGPLIYLWPPPGMTE